MKVTYRQWAIAIYLSVTNLKGVASLKLHRDIGVTQKTAWFMMHRLREAWAWAPEEFEGPVEVDETYIRGKRKNMHADRRKQFEGRGAVGKKPVVGIKDRKTKRVQAQVVDDVTKATLQEFVERRRAEGATAYTDEARAYEGLDNHETVKHGVGEYVRGMAHTNGVESFWSMLKRGYMGTYHYMSWKHLQRYVNEFTGRHNIRDMDTICQMHDVVGRAGRATAHVQGACGLVLAPYPLLVYLSSEVKSRRRVSSPYRPSDNSGALPIKLRRHDPLRARARSRTGISSFARRATYHLPTRASERESPVAHTTGLLYIYVYPTVPIR